MVSCKMRAGRAVLDQLFQQGSLKVLMPRGGGAAMTGVLLNTAGGITGGDRFEISARAATGCHLVLTTQAAERAYRAQPCEIGRVESRLVARCAARLDWLPQETLIYDGAAMRRSLRIDMASDARVLAVEPVIFGRAGMGEVVHDLNFSDRIDLFRDGDLVFADRTRVVGDCATQLALAATGNGAGAMASVLLACPDADRFLDPARAVLPVAGGASLVQPGVLFARVLARDGFELRRSLLPLIELLSAAPLPRTWMI
jgi:urease accessory protein